MVPSNTRTVLKGCGVNWDLFTLFIQGKEEPLYIKNFVSHSVYLAPCYIFFLGVTRRKRLKHIKVWEWFQGIVFIISTTTGICFCSVLCYKFYTLFSKYFIQTILYWSFNPLILYLRVYVKNKTFSYVGAVWLGWLKHSSYAFETTKIERIH